MQEGTVELRGRTDEVHQGNAFLGSILSSLHHVAVVLDREFNILMWNERASDLWGLRADEVRGRSIQCRITCTRLMGSEEGIDGVILLMEEFHDNRPPETHNSG